MRNIVALLNVYAPRFIDLADDVSYLVYELNKKLVEVLHSTPYLQEYIFLTCSIGFLLLCIQVKNKHYKEAKLKIQQK